MLLNLEENVTTALQNLFSTYKIDDCEELVKLSALSIEEGINWKSLQILAGQLNMDYDVASSAVTAIIKVYFESMKMQLNQRDFQDSLVLAGLSNEHAEKLYVYYQNISFSNEKGDTMNQKILPRYKNLLWRNDVQLATRSLSDNVVPVTTMELSCTQNGTEKNRFLQCHPTALKHLLQKLEAAQHELNSVHVQRMTRYLK